MTPLIGQILLALLFIIVGVIGGSLITILWNEREASQKTRSGQKKSAGSSQRRLDASLWRDMASGRLSVELDEGIFTKREQLSGRQRRQLMAVLQDWAEWMGIELAQGTPVAREQTPASPSQPATLSQDSQSEETGSQTAIITEPATLQEKPGQAMSNRPQERTETPGSSLPVSRPSAAEIAALGSAKPAEVKPKPTSIVGQIDEILQDMLESEPTEKRGIRLVEDPNHGVTVWVGVQRYQGIEAVKDQEALRLIRAAVEEWERRAEEARRK